MELFSGCSLSSVVVTFPPSFRSFLLPHSSLMSTFHDAISREMPLRSPSPFVTIFPADRPSKHAQPTVCLSVSVWLYLRIRTSSIEGPWEEGRHQQTLLLRSRSTVIGAHCQHMITSSLCRRPLSSSDGFSPGFSFLPPFQSVVFMPFLFRGWSG